MGSVQDEGSLGVPAQAAAPALVMCAVLAYFVDEERFRDLDFLNQLHLGLDAAVVSATRW